ncbi:MAG TPA: carboxypeptidase-like regulatory domain-containing protein [Terriglobia bacterium]|nr:carboxypeptidase-like regulatory domain-containing protein [Terriglobia bacterium]
MSQAREIDRHFLIVHVRHLFVVLLTGACWHAQILHAQFPQGVITGNVKDSESAQALTEVEIHLSPLEGAVLNQVSTNKSGDYQFLALQPGIYELRFQKPGYFITVVKPVRVESGRTSIVPLEMRKGLSDDKSPIAVDWPGAPLNLWGSANGSTFGRWQLDYLPSARNIWALLENQALSSVTNRVDEGGITTGTIGLVGAHGGSWTQNEYQFDGINVTDPFQTGKPLVYADFGTLQEFQADTSSHLSDVRAPGASFNLVSLAGGANLHGMAEGYYLGLPFQNSNLDDRLQSFGFTTTPHFQHFGEGQFALGGSVPHTDRWSFFSSFALQHLTKVIPDFSAIPTTSVYSGLLRLDGRFSPRNQIAILVSGQVANNSNLGARPNIAPSATLRGNDRFEIVQGHWTHQHSPATVWEVSGGFSHTSPTDTFQHGVSEPNQMQMFTGEMKGSAPMESDSARSRFSLQGQGQTRRLFFSDRWTHWLSFGADLEESKATESNRVFKDVQLLFYPTDVPAEVIEYNTPSSAKYRLREFSVYFDDHFQLGSRLFFRFGLTLDSSNAFLPSQTTGAGTYAPAREFGGAPGVISWTSLAPHAGLAIPILKRYGDGTRVFASFARYYHLLPASDAIYANPNSVGGSVFVWQDRNHDGFFQAGEEGQLLRVFGGPYSSIDSQLERPYSDEWVIGVEQHLPHQFHTSLRFLRRDDKRLVETVNVGVPSTAFVPVQIQDRGDDNLPGTADDQVLTVFNQEPSTFGQDRFLLTNPPDFSSVYKGLEADLRKDLREGWYLSVSFTAYKAVGPASPGNSEFENDTGVIGGLFDDPNSLLNNRGRLFFDRAYVGKISAYGRLPWGIYWGSVIKYYDGLPYGRRLVVTGLNQGPIFIMATPRGEPVGVRTEYNLTIDQRIARDWNLGRHKLSAFLDIFNLLNQNNDLQEYDLSGLLFPLRVPLEVLNPRVFRLGVKWEF